MPPVSFSPTTIYRDTNMPSTPQTAVPAQQASSTVRIRVFVDYWNFQLSLNELEATASGTQDYRFKVDWRGLGPWLARSACQTTGIDLARHSFDGVIIRPRTTRKRRRERHFTDGPPRGLTANQAFASSAARENQRPCQDVQRAIAKYRPVPIRAAGRKSSPRLKRASIH